MGKTAFAQGFAAALGVKGPVTSPTFALVRHYRCGEDSPVRTLIHADVYRTESLAEVADLALAELVEEDAVALVEWGDRAALAFGESALVITLATARSPGRPQRTRGRCHRPRLLGGPVRRGGRAPSSRAAGGGPDERRRHRNVVAIETATETVGVAVRTAAGVEAVFTLTGRRRHVETLTPALEHLLGQVGLAPGQLDVVAVDVGPGLFTGLRVGVAAAKGLAQSLGLGVIGMTSLEILTAAAARRPCGGSCWPASTPAAARSSRRPASSPRRRGDGPSWWRPGSSPRPGWPRYSGHSGARRCTPSATGRCATPMSCGSVTVSTSPRRPCRSHRRARSLALALEQMDGARPPVDPGSIVPLYMREADAKSNFARADRT